MSEIDRASNGLTIEQAGQTLRLALRPRDAAQALGISERKLWSLTSPRGPIPCVRLDRIVVYSVLSLQRWLDEQAESGGGQ